MLKSPQSRSACFAALSRLTSIPSSVINLPPDNKTDVQKKWERLNKAFVAIASAKSIGTNYITFSQLVLDFATEVNLIKDSIPNEAGASLLTAIDALTDSRAIWNESIKYKRDIIYDNTLPGNLLSKWGFFTKTNLAGRYIEVDKAMKELWERAQREFKFAERIVNE